MTDADKRLLTEFLGECFFERGNKSKSNPFTGSETWLCKKCGKFHDNREFNTPQDFYDLGRELVKVGKWEDFHYYCTQVCDWSLRPHQFSDWLFLREPVRSCQLVADFLRKEKI